MKRKHVAALLLGAGLFAAAPPGWAARPGGASRPTMEAAAGTPVVDVNTATVEELQQLPGIGEKRALAIVEARKQRGGFKSVDELVEVKGIGPANLEKLRPHLRVTGPSGAGAR